MGLGVSNKYQFTDFGLFPSDWILISIGELLRFKNGLNKEKEFFGEGTPIINYMDVFNRPSIEKKHLNGKVTLTNDEVENYSARKGDIFFTRTSEIQREIGISSVLVEKIPKCVFSGFVLRGRPISSKLSIDYSKYCFSANYVRKQIISTSSYTTRALTNGRLLSQVKIFIPKSIDEQKLIAETLTDMDNLIASLEVLVAKKRAIKFGTMQELLTGKKRLQGFEGEWKKKKLGEVCFVQGGYAFKSDNFQKNPGIPIIRISNIKKESISLNDIVYYDDKFLIPNNFKIKRGDILIAMSGATTGKIGKYQLNKVSYLNQRVGSFKLLSDSNTNKEYLFQLLTSKLFQMTLNSELEQGAQPNISGKQLENLEFGFPISTEEQEAIAEVFSDIDREIEYLEKQLSKTKKLKQGMMQELLTGKTRLIESKTGYLENKSEIPTAAESSQKYNKRTNV